MIPYLIFHLSCIIFIFWNFNMDEMNESLTKTNDIVNAMGGITTRIWVVLITIMCVFAPAVVVLGIYLGFTRGDDENSQRIP